MVMAYLNESFLTASSAVSRHENPIKVDIFIGLRVYHAITVNVNLLSAHLRNFIHRSMTINFKSIYEPNISPDRYCRTTEF